MSKREEVLVSQEEITRQKEFLHLIREVNVGRLKKYSISTFGCPYDTKNMSF